MFHPFAQRRETVPQAKGEGELRRSIGLVRATALVVGTIIGASIFVQPSEITGRVPSVAGVFAVWLVAGALTFFGAIVTAELASAFPRTGGVYVFLKEAFSPALGFLWGWAMFWSMHSGIIAAIAVVFARYVGYFTPLGDVGVRLVAIGVILILSTVNLVGVRQGSAVQTAFTIGKVAAIAVIILVGFLMGPRAVVARADVSRAAAFAGASFSLGDFALALVAGLFAFGGWHMVTYSAGETRDPERTIPWALLAGTLIVTACYVALNAVYLRVLPLEIVISSTRVAADAADAVLGSGGGALMSALVIFSTFGALSGIILAGPRVYYSMAREGHVFEWVGALHARFRTPHRAIVLQAAWASVLVATGTYRALFTRVIYTEWLFFALLAVGVLLLRRRQGYAPSYRTWGYPLVPLVFAVSSVLIVVNQVGSDPGESMSGLLLVLLGLPVYHLWLRITRSAER
ncbi:MAG: APC family permease [Gemmatimonadales bacterium]